MQLRRHGGQARKLAVILVVRQILNSCDSRSPQRFLHSTICSTDTFEPPNYSYRFICSYLICRTVSEIPKPKWEREFLPKSRSLQALRAGQLFLHLSISTPQCPTRQTSSHTYSRIWASSNEKSFQRAFRTIGEPGAPYVTPLPPPHATIHCYVKAD